MAAVAAIAVVALYFAVAAVAHTPPFTESTHSNSMNGAGTGAGTLNLTTGAESDTITGNISALGSVTGYDNLRFTFAGGGGYHYTGTRTIVTANGDKLFLAIEGSGTSPTSTTSKGTGTETISGGTGRFTGATGTYADTVSTVFSVTGTTETFRYTWTTSGNIRY